MYKIGDYVVYKKDVCKVGDIINKSDVLYYKLVPVCDSSLRIDIPVDNTNLLRDLIDKKTIDDLIKELSNIKVLKTTNNMLENNYKELLREGSFVSLMTIIKTAYLRNQEREKNNKKKSDRDNYYLDLAEKYLYTEFSVVLGMSFDDTRDYFINCMLERV